jgi:hypothetical protein
MAGRYNYRPAIFSPIHLDGQSHHLFLEWQLPLASQEALPEASIKINKGRYYEFTKNASCFEPVWRCRTDWII